MAPVARLLSLDRTSLTAQLKPLTRRGLVESVANPDDGRSRRLKLTRKGRALLIRAFPLWNAAHAELENDWRGGNLDDLRADLRALDQA